MVVRSEDLGLWIDPNNLQESAGAFAALNAKANFQRCPHFFADTIHIRRDLLRMRDVKGHDTIAGHVITNLIEGLDNLFGYVTPAWVSDKRQTLPYQIEKQRRRLERLSTGRA